MKSLLKESNMKGFFSVRGCSDLICLWCSEHVKCILVFSMKFLLLACHIDCNLMLGMFLIE